MRKPRFRVGIDVGGTKIEGIVLDSHGGELTRLRRSTPVKDGYAAVVQGIVDVYRELADSVGDAEHTLGIGTPGSISPATGLLRNCNATVMNGNPLYSDLATRLRRPFAMTNDANCFALAEARLGAAAGAERVLGLVLGTGVGGGLVAGGRVVHGRNAIAGEWGHMVLDPAGPPCYCGRRGCTERYLSGPSFEQNYAATAGTATGAARIVELARKGDQRAGLVLDQFLARFAHAVANVIAVLDPDVIVLGGGLASIDEIYTVGARRLRDVVFSDTFDTPILRNKLGNEAGVFGAAMTGV